MCRERWMSIFGRRIVVRSFRRFAQFLLVSFLAYPQLSVGQLLMADEPASSGAVFTLREITIDNWNIGLTGVFADLAVDDTSFVEWRNYNPQCGPRRINPNKTTDMVHSKSKAFVLGRNSAISFVHGLMVRGPAYDSLAMQFPDVNLFWRLRLADEQTGAIIATLDSMSLNPRKGYNECKGFFSARFHEKVNVYFGTALGSVFGNQLHLELDLQPLFLAGMDYNYQDTDLDSKYGDGLDELFGYKLMDTLRAHGTQLLDVAPAGPGMLGVDIALSESMELRMYRQAAGARQELFSGHIAEGFTRIIVPAQKSGAPCTYELVGGSGVVLASYVSQAE